MTKRQLAHSLARRLRTLDRRIERAIASDPKGFKDYAGGLFPKKYELLKEFVEKGLNLISVPVADGYAFFFESRRTRSWVVFEWLYGGADEYIPYFGGVFAVPPKAADQMIAGFKISYLKR